MTETAHVAAPRPAYGNEVLSSEDRTWGMLAHLSALAMFVLPLGNVLGPLLVWLLGREKSEFIDDQGREALNFQIGVTIAVAILALFVFIMTIFTFLLIPIPLAFLGILLIVAVVVFAIATGITGAIKANQGERYRYPIRIQLVKQ